MLPQLFLALLGACPTLDGRYVIQGEDNRVYVSITVRQCNSASVGWTYSGDSTDAAHRLALDGRAQRDSGWFGLGKQWSSARFAGDTLEIVARPVDAKTPDAVAWRLRLHQLPSGDLCTRFWDGHTLSAIVAARIGSDGESRAAQRAEDLLNGGFTRSCS